MAWRQYQELIVLRARVESDNVGSLRRRLAEDQKRLKLLQDELLAAQSRRNADDTARGDATPGQRPDWRGGFRNAMNNPEFTKLMAVQQKAALDGRYAPLFKTLTQGLNLTPQQLDQFKNLLVQKQQAMMDALQAARDQGISQRSDPQAFAEAISSAQSSMDQQIQADLGPAAFSQYQQYEQTLPQRNTVNQVQQSLSYSQTPLTDDQAGQLIQILAQDQPPTGSNSGGGNIRGLFNNNATGPVTAQALADAANILAPDQVQALQQIQQAQQARQQMQQLLRSSATAGGGGAFGPPPP